MPIYDRHKLIFHHVPKTGGRAIESWLGGADAHPGHLAAWILRQELEIRSYSAGENDRLAFPSFTIIRDPVDRIRSAWMHHKRESRETLQDWPHLFDCSFESAILHDDFTNLLRDGMRSVHFFPLSWMFSKTGGALFLPDISLDFNNLEGDCSRLAERFSLDVDPFVFSSTEYEKLPLGRKAMKKFRWLYNTDYKIIPHLRSKVL